MALRQRGIGWRGNDTPVIPRPIRYPGFADDPIERQRPPLARVAAVVAVVAHHEDRSGWNDDRLPVAAWIATPTGRLHTFKIWLIEQLIVHKDLPVFDDDRISGQTNHAFDVVFTHIARILEYHHFATPRQVERIDDLGVQIGLTWQELKRGVQVEVKIDNFIDQNILPGMQAGLHTLALDFEVLNDTANDQEHQQDEDRGLQQFFYDTAYTLRGALVVLIDGGALPARDTGPFVCHRMGRLVETEPAPQGSFVHC